MTTKSGFAKPKGPQRRKRGRAATTRLFILPNPITPRIGEFLKLEGDFKEETAPNPLEYSPVYVYLHEELDRINIRVEIRDDTNGWDLRDAIPLLIALRDRLIRFQGLWLSGGANNFYELLARLKRRGASWAELADLVNDSVASHLVDWSQSGKSQGAKQNGGVSSLDQAKYLLRLMKITEPEIDTICAEALDNIARGKKPFYGSKTGHPLDKDEVRSTVTTHLKISSPSR